VIPKGKQGAFNVILLEIDMIADSNPVGAARVEIKNRDFELNPVSKTGKERPQ
jgi:hypothetical protein